MANELQFDYEGASSPYVQALILNSDWSVFDGTVGPSSVMPDDDVSAYFISMTQIGTTGLYVADAPAGLDLTLSYTVLYFDYDGTPTVGTQIGQQLLFPTSMPSVLGYLPAISQILVTGTGVAGIDGSYNLDMSETYQNHLLFRNVGSLAAVYFTSVTGAWTIALTPAGQVESSPTDYFVSNIGPYPVDGSWSGRAAYAALVARVTTTGSLPMIIQILKKVGP